MRTEIAEQKSTWSGRLRDPNRRHTSYSRLCSSFKTFQARSKAMIKAKHAENAEWAVGVEQLEKDIEGFIKQGDMDAAWRCLDAAKQLMIFGYDQNELDDEAIVLRREAPKYKSPVKEALYDLLGKPADPQKGKEPYPPVDVHRLDQALRLKNGCNADYYEAISQRRKNLKIMTRILAGAIVIIPVLAILFSLPEPLDDWKMIIAVGLFGILGASFTTAKTLTKSSLKAKIPDRVITNYVTSLRSLIGAAAALAAYAFLQANVFENVISTDVTGSDAGILAIAFIAGFSERFVIKAVADLPAPDKQKETES